MLDQPTRGLSVHGDPSEVSVTSDANQLTVARNEPITIDSAALSLPPTAGRYAFLDELARGGMGIVVRANDTVLGREVAVKLLSERFALDSPAARRFVDEARIAGQLQ